MKNQAHFLRKINVKKLKCCLLQFLSGTLRVNIHLSSLLKIRLSCWGKINF